MDDIDTFLQKLKFSLLTFSKEEQVELLEAIEAIAIVEMENKSEEVNSVCKIAPKTIQ